MKCRFCGEPAGFMKTQHQECAEAFEKGKQYIRECIDHIYQQRDCMNIGDVVRHTVKRYHIPGNILKSLLAECWRNKAAEAMADGVVSEDEISILGRMIAALGIDSREAWQSDEGKKLAEHGRQNIRTMVYNAMKSGNMEGLAAQLDHAADLYGFPLYAATESAVDAWKTYIGKALDDGIISPEEERAIETVSAELGILPGDHPEEFRKVTQGAILRDVLNGVTFSRVSLTGDIPVILQKKEVVLWIFNHTELYEERTRRHYTGSSAGVSIRVARGVYVRSGSFKGYPVETTEAVYLGSGALLVTNENLFWVPPASKVIKIPVKKIIAITPASDGIIIQKDGVTAKPQYFRTNDAWFSYNLISNLNILE